MYIALPSEFVQCRLLLHMLLHTTGEAFESSVNWPFSYVSLDFPLSTPLLSYHKATPMSPAIIDEENLPNAEKY